MDKNTEADISELVQLMFVGLMGAYKEIENVLKNFHDKNDKPSRGFLFIESLVHQPLYKEPSPEQTKTWIIHPFPYRFAKQSLFLTDQEIAQQKYLIRLDASIFTQHMYERWKDETYFCRGNELKFVRLDEIFIDTQEFSGQFFAVVEEKATKYILKHKIKKLEKSEDPALIFSGSCLERLRAFLKGLESLRFCSLHPSEDKSMISFLIPMASSQIFYGDLFVCVPHFDNDDKLKQLASGLIRCVKKYYVPSLALIHEHFFGKVSK